MSKGEELTEEQWLDMIVLIMVRNGGSIERQQLLNEMELYEEDLDDLIDTLESRGLITFAYGSLNVGSQNMEGWILARLTEEGTLRAREFERGKKNSEG